MKIWITGIAGFLGSHLADELIKLDHHVCGNDNHICSSDETKLGQLVKDDPTSIGHYVDCRTQDVMFTALDNYKPDVLIHCAATAHEGLSNFSPSFITRNIYEASVSTFSAAIASGVRRIIFMSSMARYGNGVYKEIKQTLGKAAFPTDFGLPFEEWHSTAPIDPYGIAKVAAEQTLVSLCKLHNVEYVIAVPHNIIGPRQKYDDPYRNVASIMINRALQGKPIYVYGDGLQTRCFSPIKDCLDSLIKMIDAPISGEVINIGPDKDPITVLRLAGMITSITGGMSTIEHLPARPNEVKDAYCLSNKARSLLGYEAKQSLLDCLTEMVSYIKEHGAKEFKYSFPIEIENGCPSVWKDKML